MNQKPIVLGDRYALGMGVGVCVCGREGPDPTCYEGVMGIERGSLAMGCVMDLSYRRIRP